MCATLCLARGVADWLQTIICRCVLDQNSTIEILRWFENTEEKTLDGKVRTLSAAHTVRELWLTTLISTYSH